MLYIRCLLQYQSIWKTHLNWLLCDTCGLQATIFGDLAALSFFSFSFCSKDFNVQTYTIVSNLCNTTLPLYKIIKPIFSSLDWCVGVVSRKPLSVILDITEQSHILSYQLFKDGGVEVFHFDVISSFAKALSFLIKLYTYLHIKLDSKVLQRTPSQSRFSSSIFQSRFMSMIVALR